MNYEGIVIVAELSNQISYLFCPTKLGSNWTNVQLNSSAMGGGGMKHFIAVCIIREMLAHISSSTLCNVAS